jgi:hypothetical protein
MPTWRSSNQENVAGMTWRRSWQLRTETAKKRWWRNRDLRMRLTRSPLGDATLQGRNVFAI